MNIEYESKWSQYTSIISIAIIIGICLYHRRLIKSLFCGCYKFIKDRDYQYYFNMKYLYFMMITFIVVLVINIQTTHFWPHFVINGIFLFLVSVKDGERDIEDVSGKDYIQFAIIELLGLEVLGISGASLVFFRKSQLNESDCYNVYVCNLIAICCALLVKNFTFTLNMESSIVFFISVVIGYLFIFIFRYLHSLNRLRWLGLIAIFIALIKCGFTI